LRASATSVKILGSAIEFRIRTFTDADGTTSGVDEPSTLLHLGNEFLVEEALGLLVKRAIDGDNIGLSKHLLERLNSSAADFLRGLFRKGLVIKVEEFLAVEGYKTSQYSFTDTADTDGSDDFAFEIEGVLGDGSNVPVTASNLFVGGDKVPDEGEHGEDDVLSDGDDIGSGDFGNKDLFLVGSIKINVIGT